MSEGQGFARRVTLANLHKFAPLLKPRRVAQPGATEPDEDSANEGTPLDPAVTQAEAEFTGTRVTVTLPFTRPTLQPQGGSRRRRPRREAVAGAEQPAGETPTTTTNDEATAGVRVEDYDLLWQSKPLTRRDLTIPDTGRTNQTGSVNLDKGLLEPAVDHRHFFRDEVFAHLPWHRRRPTVDEASATFHLIAMGVDYGDATLFVRHTTSTNTRAYQQRNAMTRLSWGDFRTHVARADLFDRTLSLYRHRADPTRFLLRIE
jgi:hypothetical protein